MASSRRTTQSLPLRSVPPHLRASAHVRGAAPIAAPIEVPAWKRAAISAGLIGFAVAFGFLAWWVLYGSLFRVTDVRISELQAVDPLEVSAAAAVTGKTLFTVDRGKVEAAVAAVPGVRSVQVRRAWPNAVAIDIQEAQGWGFWEVAGHRVVVDEHGTALERGRVPASQALVIYEDAPTADPGAAVAPNAETVQLVRRLIDEGAFSILRVVPTGFTYNHERGLTVHVAQGPRVIFGDAHDFDFKVATWGALLDRVESQRLAVSEIDLRYGKHVVMR